MKPSQNEQQHPKERKVHVLLLLRTQDNDYKSSWIKPCRTVWTPTCSHLSETVNKLVMNLDDFKNSLRKLVPSQVIQNFQRLRTQRGEVRYRLPLQAHVANSARVQVNPVYSLFSQVRRRTSSLMKQNKSGQEHLKCFQVLGRPLTLVVFMPPSKKDSIPPPTPHNWEKLASVSLVQQQRRNHPKVQEKSSQEVHGQQISLKVNLPNHPNPLKHLLDQEQAEVITTSREKEKLAIVTLVTGHRHPCHDLSLQSFPLALGTQSWKSTKMSDLLLVNAPHSSKADLARVALRTTVPNPRVTLISLRRIHSRSKPKLPPANSPVANLRRRLSPSFLVVPGQLNLTLNRQPNRNPRMNKNPLDRAPEIAVLRLRTQPHWKERIHRVRSSILLMNTLAEMNFHLPQIRRTQPKEVNLNGIPLVNNNKSTMIKPSLDKRTSLKIKNKNKKPQTKILILNLENPMKSNKQNRTTPTTMQVPMIWNLILA
eukprot:PhF_6_TR38614/c0_g1_i1/m.57519